MQSEARALRPVDKLIRGTFVIYNDVCYAERKLGHFARMEDIRLLTCEVLHEQRRGARLSTIYGLSDILMNRGNGAQLSSRN